MNIPDAYHVDRAARQRILDEQTRARIRKNWHDAGMAGAWFLALFLVGLAAGV